MVVQLPLPLPITMTTLSDMKTWSERRTQASEKETRNMHAFLGDENACLTYMRDEFRWLNDTLVEPKALQVTPTIRNAVVEKLIQLGYLTTTFRLTEKGKAALAYLKI